MNEVVKALKEAADALYYIWECRGGNVDWVKVRSLALWLYNLANGQSANIEPEELKNWAVTQIEIARSFIESNVPDTGDACDTPEYHLGFCQAMRCLLDKIKELEGEA